MTTYLTALTHLSPDAALVSLTLGTLLLYLELNRPGWIVPGALGLVLVLFAVASLGRFPLQAPAVTLIATAIVILGLDLARPVSKTLAAAGIIALVLGLTCLVRRPESQPVHPLISIVCALILGVATSLLTGVARRARTNKRVRLTKSAF